MRQFIFFLFFLYSNAVFAQTTLIDFGANWKYSDNGTSPADQAGVNWTGLDYDDTGWEAGPAELGYGDGDEATTMNNSVVTAYFRHSFTVADPPLFSELEMQLIYDDGAVVYLNGVELWAENMPAPPYNYNTFAASTSSDNALATMIAANSLQTGTNVIAIEVHQRSASSSDLSFNFKLLGNETATDFLINPGTAWQYYDAGNAPANQNSLNWTDLAFDATSWNSGNAQLGYGDGDEATLLNANAFTCYFRHVFNVSNPMAFTDLGLNLTYDDGAVIYLNGIEIKAVNMPLPPYTYDSFSIDGSPDNALENALVQNTLVSGDNVLAVEIHQRNEFSSDLSFDLNLIGNNTTDIILTRGPYLQKAAPNAMTVKWRTSGFANSTLAYGTALGNLTDVVSGNGIKTEHELTISSLIPNTRYYYEIRNVDVVIRESNAELYFITPPEFGTKQPLSAWILGDCGTKNANQRAVRDAYYNYIGDNHTDMMLFLGDNAYDDGTDQEYQYALFENMYEDKLKNTVSWATLGNHDGHTADSDSQTGPYYDIFSFPTNGESGGLASGTEAYYSFDFGNVHFIVLESHETDKDIAGAMYNWCLNDIQNTMADWVIAFWHHPAYTKGSHDSDIEFQLIDMREIFLPMLEENGVDLVLSGHSHSYERSYFINGHYGVSSTFDINVHGVGPSGGGSGQADGDGAYEKSQEGSNADKGAVYVTAGSSGKISGGSLDHAAMFYAINALGSCVLEIDGANLNVKFLRENGTIPDYFTITKPDIVGVNNAPETDMLKAYPNPAGDYFTLTAPFGEILKHVILYDNSGKAIRKDNISRNEIRLHCHNLPAALYYYKAETTNGKSYTGKLFIE